MHVRAGAVGAGERVCTHAVVSLASNYPTECTLSSV